MQRKHFYIGTGALVLLVAIAATLYVATSKAQGDIYTFAVSLNTGQLTVEQGAIVDFTGTVAANSNNSGPDTITASVSVTHSDPASPVPSCTVSPSASVSLPAGQSQSFMVTCQTSSATRLGTLTATLQISAAHVSNIMYGSKSVSVIAPTTTASACTSLTLTLANGKTSYVEGEMVNYTYTCVPAGTRAANTLVQVVHPSGNVTTYNSGTNIDTASSGVSTSNIGSGTHTLQVCLGSTCPGTSSASAAFTVTAAPGTTTGTITLYGTIFKDGQYIDPATGSLRNCVSPNAWMKEVATSTGARGFHCMPNYTPIATDAPPASCTGTLWAGSSFSSDTCGTTAPSTSTTTSTCASGQVWCPAVAGSSSPAGCYATCPTATTTGGTTTSCANGERCSSGSWCSNGSQCYYPNGDLTCVAWSTSGTAVGTAIGPAVSMPECPSGTSECSPTDTNCVGSGQTVPYSSGKWCRNSQQYYSSDGTQLACVKMGATAPAGFSTCRPDDTNCISAGSYGSSSGWCSMGQQCYQTAQDTNANNDKYCAPWSYSGTSPGADTVNCPSGYSVCSPTDTNCKQKGDKWSDSNTSYWCSNSKKCSTATGGICVGWSEDCPSGSKVCDANQVANGCLENGEERTFTSGSGAYPYCASGGITVYSGTIASYTARCIARPANLSWDSKWVPDVPAGYRFCRPENATQSSQCLEPGQTGSSSSWCGYWPMMGGTTYATATSGTSATRTCPNIDGTMPSTTPPPPPPPPPVPPPVTPPYDLLPECKDGESMGSGFNGPSCRMPYYCWKDGQYVKAPMPSYNNPVMSDAAVYSPRLPLPVNNTCGSFRAEELACKTLWAKKYDPSKYGIWHWPSYPSNTPSYKYNPSTDSLVSCEKDDTNYYMTSMVDKYQSPCQQMSAEDKPLFLCKFQSEYQMFQDWKKNREDRDKEKVCPQVTQPAIDPVTNTCKTFPTPCDVPNNWKTVPKCSFKDLCPKVSPLTVCPDGHTLQVVDERCGLNVCIPDDDLIDGEVTTVIDQKMCMSYLQNYRDEIRMHRLFLHDMRNQLKDKGAVRVFGDSLEDTLKRVNEAEAYVKKLAGEIDSALKNAAKEKKCAASITKTFDAKLEKLRTEIMPSFADSQDAMRLVADCRYFDRGLKDRVRTLKLDAKRFGEQEDEDTSNTLNNAAGQMEALQTKATAACTSLDRFGLDDVQFELSLIEQDIANIFSQNHTTNADQFILAKINGILTGIGNVRQTVRTQNLQTECTEAVGLMGKVEVILQEGIEAFEDGDKRLAGEKLVAAESYRDIVFDSFGQCGLQLDMNVVAPDILQEKELLRRLVGNIENIDDAMLDRIVGRVIERATAKVAAVIDEKMNQMLTEATKAFEEVGARVDQIVASMENIQKAVQDEAKLQEFVTAREEILDEAKAVLAALKENTRLLGAADRDKLENALAKATEVAWCGDLRAEMPGKIRGMQSALATGTVTTVDVAEFVGLINDKAYTENPVACYNEGVSRFKDPGMSAEQWYFAHFNGEDPAFKGKYGPDGKPLGIVEYGRQALWMEGAMVVARITAVPNVDGKCEAPAGVAGASTVPYGACALNYFIKNDIPLPEHPVQAPMTRVELCSLIVSVAGDTLPITGDSSNLEGYDDVQYEDAHGPAVATCVANKLMVGKSEGRFAPYDVPTRAELAAVKDRFVELRDFTAVE